MSKVDPVFQNAMKLYCRFKTVENKWWSILKKYNQEDIVSFTPELLKELQVVRSRKADKALWLNPMLIAQITPPHWHGNEQTILSLQPNKWFMHFLNKRIGKAGVLATAAHEDMHAIQSSHGLAIDKYSTVNFRNPILALYQKANLSPLIILQVINEIICYRLKKILSRWVTVNNIPLNERVGKIIKKLYLSIEPKVLAILRKAKPEDLKNIKLNSLIEFQAIDKSIKYVEQQEMTISKAYKSMTEDYRSLYSQISKWVRMVEKERRLAAVTKP